MQVLLLSHHEPENEKGEHRDGFSSAGGAGCSCHWGFKGNAFTQWRLCCRALSSSQWHGQDCQSDEKREDCIGFWRDWIIPHWSMCSVRIYSIKQRKYGLFCLCLWVLPRLVFSIDVPQAIFYVLKKIFETIKFCWWK